jgi:cytidyltransferase-like protein
MSDTSTILRDVADKLVPFGELRQLRERLAGKKIVQCHGAFDLVHIGHLIHFEEAKTQGDVLVVTITADRFITKKRGVTFPETYRAQQVAALAIVDYVALVPEPTALSAVIALQPDVYVKGPEYRDLALDKSRSVYHEMRALDEYGGRMYFTSGETFSSTKIAHFLRASSEAGQRSPLLRNDQVLFRDVSDQGFKIEQIKEFLARAATLRVCLIGETIVDEWVDVALTNMSTQSRCVAGREHARERQIGGTGIIARHLANFVREVHCFTNDLETGLAPNLSVHPIAPGELVETRFVDRDTGHPLFKSRRHGLTPMSADALPTFNDYDLVLVADYGHGLIDAAAVNEAIASKGCAFVGVMAQVNSGNYGHSLPLKYRGADFYSLNRTEAELCLHDRGIVLHELVERTAGLLGGRAVSVTDGAQGAAIKVDEVRFALPSLSVQVIDTIGCGDAYFALSAAAACVGMPPSVVVLVGSIGAAAMTQRRCNESPVTESEFMTIGKIVI